MFKLFHLGIQIICYLMKWRYWCLWLAMIGFLCSCMGLIGAFQKDNWIFVAINAFTGYLNRSYVVLFFQKILEEERSSKLKRTTK